jgi:hypothetical protein
MKNLQKKLQSVETMPLDAARAEYERLSTLIESRYGLNRFGSRPIRVADKREAAQLRRLRSKLRDRIQTEEGALTE